MLYTTSSKKSQASYYVWLDSLPIAQIDLTYSAGTTIASTTLTYLHSDYLNTPRLATNQGGNLVWSWPSDAFGVGQPNNHGSTIDVILRFPGQIADAHSALYYNYFRDYDPETGRYVESDPIGLDGGLNTFGYVGANPTTVYDSFGLDAQYVYEKYGYLDGFIINYQAGFRSKGIAEDASLDWARKHALFTSPKDFNGGGADAIRHCVWSCEMTRRLGGGIGRDIGEMHERDNGDSASEMDRQNNQMGCFIGENGDPNKSCTELCYHHFPDLIKEN
ncbi:RHS repeat-associated core domain-containing protein [Pseudomonas otitidis]|uniref:RHS repeat-associated core domain-containing protein n=1 Tax=Metapseudomonas otitidis TaxID=319939 RepID=A0ABU3XUF3_9GAMM|nr:RHS repeat-associated core domain-containing protein [Pseudomonas otitidis]MDV3441547.1 RHS repeat-associated core domain-containing protein [Pseudomonas otitidis]